MQTKREGGRGGSLGSSKSMRVEPSERAFFSFSIQLLLLFFFFEGLVGLVVRGGRAANRCLAHSAANIARVLEREYLSYTIKSFAC